MLHGVTEHLPPPTGAPLPPPGSDLPHQADRRELDGPDTSAPPDAASAETVPVPQAPASTMPPPGPPPGSAESSSTASTSPFAPPSSPPSGSPFASPAGSPFAAPQGSPFTSPPAAPHLSPYQSPYASPVPTPGHNGLAIAALCCGIAGLFAPAAVVGIVLGIVALGQLRRRVQQGKGMAVAGIVLGALWLLGWVALIVFLPEDAPAPSAAPTTVTQRHEVFVEALKAGDCFSGGRKDAVDLVTVVPCASPHESQVVVTFELPAGPYPGDKAVSAAAEKGCSEKADPLITDKAYDELDPSSISPSDAYTWRGDRTVVCVVEAPSGTTTGSALS